MVQIETARLFLCTWDEEDWLAFKPIATDTKVMRYITGGRPWADDEIQHFVERNRTTFQERGFCRWKLVERQTGELIGFCGIGYLSGLADPEIGWWLASDHWGRGYAIEAAKAALDDATRHRNLKRLISIADPENFRSIRVMQKLGFELENHSAYKGKPVAVYAFNA